MLQTQQLWKLGQAKQSTSIQNDKNKQLTNGMYCLHSSTTYRGDRRRVCTCRSVHDNDVWLRLSLDASNDWKRWKNQETKNESMSSRCRVGGEN